MVDVVLRSYFMTPANEPKLTNSEEVRKVISFPNFSNVLGPSDIPNTAFKYLPQRAGSPGPDFQLVPPQLSFPYSVEARSSDLCSQTGEGPNTGIILSGH
jgi:hypothetical protein